MNWKNLGAGQWEAQGKHYDFAIDGTNGDCALHIFDSAIGDNDKAYIESVPCDTIAQAKSEALNYN